MSYTDDNGTVWESFEDMQRSALGVPGSDSVPGLVRQPGFTSEGNPLYYATTAEDLEAFRKGWEEKIRNYYPVAILPNPKPRLHVKFEFNWHDLWIGAYVKTTDEYGEVIDPVVYVCPLPCCVFTIRRY